MPIIHLIRHGSNDYLKEQRLAGRQAGIHLNKAGRKQAKAVAKHFKGQKIKAIYSSPLERAWDTAEPIAETLDLEIVEEPGLLETDIGDYQGHLIKELSKREEWKTVQQSPSQYKFPGGESFIESQKRIASTLKILAAELEDKDQIICVSHSDPIKLAIASLIGLPLDKFQRLMIHPASISSVFIGKEHTGLITLNQIVYKSEKKK